VFQARGDGKKFNVLVFSESRGARPAVSTFDTTADWQEHHLKLADFGGIDGHDVTGVFFGLGSPGAFWLQVDDVAFR
jgi:hypothetical protein